MKNKTWKTNSPFTIIQWSLERADFFFFFSCSTNIERLTLDLVPQMFVCFVLIQVGIVDSHRCEDFVSEWFVNTFCKFSVSLEICRLGPNSPKLCFTKIKIKCSYALFSFYTRSVPRPVLFFFLKHRDLSALYFIGTLFYSLFLHPVFINFLSSLCT